MSRDHFYPGADHATDAGPASTGIAPGKRSLTQGLMPVQRQAQPSLRDEQRPVASFDDGVGDDLYDERATVEGKPTATPLTDQQLRRAQRKNPGWVQRLKVSAQIFSSAEPASAAFALDVAEKQAQSGGLKVDGIAGPKTVRAIAGEVAAARSTEDAGRFAGDDPFGMHLLGG